MKQRFQLRGKQLLAIICLLTASWQAQASPYILDTDMAIDDWFALLYLAKSPDAELKAVTVACSGESHCDTGKNNAISLLNLVKNQPQIPVAAGDPYPLDGYFVFPAPWRKDADTLSGIQLLAPTYKPAKQSAREVLHQVISISDEPVTLVAVGPLTNIAQWLQTYPKDMDNVNRLVIMGGTLDTKGNIIVPKFTDGHPNKTSEWNFFVDPLAARIVLASGMPIALVGLDVTKEVKVTHEYVENFDSLVSNPASRFAQQVYQKNDWFIESGEYYFWDVLAALVSTRPEMCVSELTSVKVTMDYVQKPAYTQSSDFSMPAKRWDGKPRRNIRAATAGQVSRAKNGPVIDVCMQTDASMAYDLFTRTLTGRNVY